MGTKKYTIIGGDLRNIKLAHLLSEDGNTVNIFGFRNIDLGPGLYENENLEKAIDESDVVVGPIPCSNDNETLNAPFYPDNIHVNEIFKIMSKNQLFIAGRISDKISQLAQIYNVYCIDLLEREEMAVLNAIPTAEGAIQIAMEEMPVTLHDSSALVLGYGRVGKTLSKLLSSIGADVYVGVRKYSDMAWIKSNRLKVVPLNKIADCLPGMDVIFNTIPTLILDNALLNRIHKDCLIIDLASKPGGVDFQKAKGLGLKTLWALSLPGKVAPITAARFIKETVCNIIDELGV